MAESHGGGCCPPMDLMRSEPMQLVQVIVPMESAHLTVSYLGDLGLVQFEDLNSEKSPFQRTYAAQILQGLDAENLISKNRFTLPRVLIYIEELRSVGSWENRQGSNFLKLFNKKLLLACVRQLSRTKTSLSSARSLRHGNC